MLVTGSLYLLSQLIREGGAERRSNETGMTDHLRMLGLVALVVATVILLFFTVGYVLGRILL